MPTGPKGQKRPTDAIGRAVKIAQIATGEVDDEEADDPKKGIPDSEKQDQKSSG